MDISSRELDHIKDRPELYFGARSIVRLASFIQGYNYHEGLVCQNSAYAEPWIEFSDWLAEREGLPSVLGWQKILLCTSRDDRDAFERFWMERNRFLRERLQIP